MILKDAEESDGMKSSKPPCKSILGYAFRPPARGVSITVLTAGSTKIKPIDVRNEVNIQLPSKRTYKSMSP